MTDDINHTSVSALSSAMYNSDLKSSSLSSSQQPCGAENNFFHNDNNNNDYSQRSHNNQQQQQYSLHQEQLVHGPLTNPSLHRSSPIAIQRSPSNRKKEIGDHLSRSIYDDDDDDSDIDVEGDAIKLRRKYGNNIVQTYQPESSILSSTAAAETSNNRFRNHNRSLSASASASASILNAPYFGSLSRSTNQILSLPPMSLGGGDNNITMYDDDGQVIVEPPESIISYGSLRDSHERGRFLDGPSSYREPMSGKIRQLDHRLRYHGSRQPAAELNNIGERLREGLQQSRKLKELRQKEENMKKKSISNNKNKEGGLYDDDNNNDKGNDNNDDDNYTTINKGELQDQKMAGTSSLSAMMNGVSQSVNPPEEYSSLGPEILMPIETGIQDYHENQISTEELPSPSRMMLSTSLTAFELLKTSNKDNIISDYDKRVASTGGQQGQSTTLLSLAPLVTTVSNKNNTELFNLMSLNTTQTTTKEIRKPHNDNGFQVLARSMSDPSPRFYHNNHHSLQQSSGTTTLSANNISMFLPAATTTNNQTEAINNNNAMQQVPPYNTGQLLRENHHTSSPFISDHNNNTIILNGHGSGSQLDHDPNTDGAFGDMEPNTDFVFGDMDM
jgi:hypothetical protein